MTGSVVHGGWAFVPLSSFVSNRLCMPYTVISRPNYWRFGHRKAYPLTTNCLSDGAVTIAASDHNYGSKQVISVTPRVYDYLLTNVREPPVSSYGFFECFISVG